MTPRVSRWCGTTPCPGHYSTVLGLVGWSEALGTNMPIVASAWVLAGTVVPGIADFSPRTGSWEEREGLVDGCCSCITAHCATTWSQPCTLYRTCQYPEAVGPTQLWLEKPSEARSMGKPSSGLLADGIVCHSAISPGPRASYHSQKIIINWTQRF